MAEATHQGHHVNAWLADELGFYVYLDNHKRR